MFTVKTKTGAQQFETLEQVRVNLTIIGREFDTYCTFNGIDETQPLNFRSTVGAVYVSSSKGYNLVCRDYSRLLLAINALNLTL